MTQQAQPGWYPNQYGQLQWWDGTQWGVVHHLPTSQLKNPTTAYLLLIFLGTFGAHRYYLKDPALGTVMLLGWWGGWALTLAGVGFIILAAVVAWWIVDLFLIPTLTRRVNGLT